MEKIEIKNSNLKISKIALGCMRIADLSVDEVEILVKKALEVGINFFDHADIYGGGKSEELFGEVLKRNPELRSKMIIQTKCGIVPGKMYDFSKEHIIKSVNESLEKLNVDYVDILLLHRPDALCDPLEVAEAIDQLYTENKIKYFGVSNHNPYQIELLKKYLKQPILFNQVQFSIVHSNMIDVGLNVNMTNPFAIDRDGFLLDYCRVNDITLQPWSVVQASWEEGCFIDHPNYKELNLVLDELANKYNVSKGAVSLAWILRHPANMQPIVGTASPKRLDELAEAVKVKLTREEWYKLYMANNKKLP